MAFDPEAPSDEAAGIFGLTTPAIESALVLVPIDFDATASYGRRARFGPDAILRASHQVDLFDLETGRPYAAGIAMLPTNPDVERWNTEASRAVDSARASSAPLEVAQARAEVDRCGELLNRWLYEETRAWLERGKLMGLVGGDHSTPYGFIRAHLERYPEMGILHVDAHADLREAYEGFTWSHASIMHNIVHRLPAKKLVHVGLRDVAESEMALIEASGGRQVAFTDVAMSAHLHAGKPLSQLIERIVGELPDDVYVSFDIDGLDPALCPNTGTPVPGGLSFPAATALLGAIRATGRRIVGFDLVEVASSPDLMDEWDGNVGARLLYKLCGHALAGTRGHLRRA